MDISNFGKPDLAIAGLRVWIHGLEFDGSTDYWDGNWLRVTANCADKGASITVSGSIIHLGEIVQLLNGCQAMNETLSGSASMPCIEPNLDIKLVARDHGHVEATIEITPDHLTQKHSFTFGIDQSYLPGIIDDCRRVLEEYPVRAQRPKQT